jgi:hypothetical protein
MSKMKLENHIHAPGSVEECEGMNPTLPNEFLFTISTLELVVEFINEIGGVLSK